MTTQHKLSKKIKTYTLCGVGGLVFIIAAMLAYPQYTIYSRNAAGKAKLAEAVNASQVLIKTAGAQAEAERLRAEGVADAITTIGGGLKGNPAYLKYLLVNGLNDKDNNTIIYLPQEGYLPIMEAGRLQPNLPVKP